jgi:hypothetical protein
MPVAGKDTVKRSFASAAPAGPGIMAVCVTPRGAFFGGELDDDEVAQAAYAQHLETISPRLPAPVLKLAGLNLHDATIEDVLWEPAVKRLRLSLLTLDPPSRYQAVALTYSGALLGEQRICTLRDVARDRKTEILESEVDCDDEGVFSHRLLFWPRDELTIDFTDLSLEIADREDRRVNLGRFFAEILPEDED